MPTERTTYSRDDERKRTPRRAGENASASTSTRSSARARANAEASRPAQRRRASGEQDADRQPERRRTDGAQDTERQGERRRAPKKQLPAYKQEIMRWRQYGVNAFVVIMLVGAFMGVLFPIRPTTSDFEKRDLTKFPEFTIESFIDGTFFDGLNLWFSDTYPLREPLVKLDHAVESLYGIHGGVQMYGGNVKADEIPTDTSSEKAPVVREVVDPPDEQVLQEDIQDNIMNGLYVEDGKACSMYYFDQEAVGMYTEAINIAAERLDGVATVYSILIPNNSGATLDEDVLAQLGGTDQKEALRYFHSLFSPDVVVVETYDQLRAHRDEYIYFRTDHHWTELGAYYAYESFCAAKGIEPSDITKWEQHDYEPFLGSFYQELWLPEMEENPDTVHVYIPTGTNDMVYWADGEEYECNIIADATDYGVESKYMCFIYGDQGLNKIENPNITDGSCCLLVKDSYGCAFAPLLVDNYQTIWIIDFRYFDGNIPDFAYEHGVQDVIFLNNMTIAGTQSVAETLLNLVS